MPVQLYSFEDRKFYHIKPVIKKSSPIEFKTIDKSSKSINVGEYLRFNTDVDESIFKNLSLIAYFNPTHCVCCPLRADYTIDVWLSDIERSNSIIDEQNGEELSSKGRMIREMFSKIGVIPNILARNRYGYSTDIDFSRILYRGKNDIPFNSFDSLADIKISRKRKHRHHNYNVLLHGDVRSFYRIYQDRNIIRLNNEYHDIIGFILIDCSVLREYVIPYV